MKITERIYDATTGETKDIERTLSAEEVAIREQLELESKARAEAVAKNAADKAALLEKLGISEDEAKLLLG
jgi:hypothetical protein